MRRDCVDRRLRQQQPASRGPSLPTEQQLRRDRNHAAPDFSAVPALSGIPGGVSHADFSSVPSFSFLDEARVCIRRRPTAPIPPVPALPIQKIPYETEIRDLPRDGRHTKTAELPAMHRATWPRRKSPARLHAIWTHGFRSIFSNTQRPSTRWKPRQASRHCRPIPNRPTSADLSSIPFDVNAIRRDFPILQERDQRPATGLARQRRHDPKTAMR